MSNNRKKTATQGAHILERIVVVERGSCTGQLSNLAGPNQLVVVQDAHETLPQFILRTSLQKCGQPRTRSALILLGEDTSLAPRRMLLDVLAKQLIPSKSAEIQLVSGDAADRKWVAWQLLEEVHRSKALRGIRLGFKEGETPRSATQQSA